MKKRISGGWRNENILMVLSEKHISGGERERRNVTLLVFVFRRSPWCYSWRRSGKERFKVFRQTSVRHQFHSYLARSLPPLLGFFVDIAKRICRSNPHNPRRSVNEMKKSNEIELEFKREICVRIARYHSSSPLLHSENFSFRFFNLSTAFPPSTEMHPEDWFDEEKSWKASSRK